MANMFTINPDSAFLQNANDSPFLFLGLHRASFREGEAVRPLPRAIAFFNVGWDQLASSAGPPKAKCRKMMVGRRGEAPLVPPYILPNFKKAHSQ